jgi:hypothetical protein
MCFCYFQCFFSALCSLSPGAWGVPDKCVSKDIRTKLVPVLEFDVEALCPDSPSGGCNDGTRWLGMCLNWLK